MSGREHPGQVNVETFGAYCHWYVSAVILCQCECIFQCCADLLVLRCESQCGSLVLKF